MEPAPPQDGYRCDPVMAPKYGSDIFELFPEHNHTAWLDDYKNRDGHGFMEATNMKLAGNSTEHLALDTMIVLSSSGCRITSRTDLLNSGSSSRNKTPLCANEISPGCGIVPSPNQCSIRNSMMRATKRAAGH